MTPLRTARIFLSSTFRDFEEERRLLVQEVFPALRERLRGRFVELVDIDLRWGISAEEAEQGRTLSICLEEIDQCRPYFIALLGERYGWVPPEDGYPEHLGDSHPWLAPHRGVASVTELEIRHGVLEDPKMHPRALFFFRDPAYAHLRGGEFLPSPADRARQADLKQRILDSGLPVSTYATPADLAPVLQDQLWKLLDAEFPADGVPDARALDDLEHAAFAASRLGPRFVEDPDRLAQFAQALGRDRQAAAAAPQDREEGPKSSSEAGQTGSEAAAEDASPILGRNASQDARQHILVTGPAGIGKSTLLAKWLACCVPPRTKVLSHFLEAADESASPVNLLRRLIEPIRHHTGCEDPVPEDRTGLLQSLPHWFAVAHSHAHKTGERWLILLDGLDRLRSARDLLWLPTYIPPSICLIASCRPGPVQAALKRRAKWCCVELKPVPSQRQRLLFEHQLRVFKKSLSEQQVAAVLRDPRASQPLFLCTLAEELRLYGSFEGLQRHLEDLLASADLDDLYEKTLARLEAHHDPATLRRALSALCLSQGGLTEQEILEFSGLAYQARWSPIRLALGDALFRAFGRVRPAHEHLRKAVRDRYYHDHEAERALRLELARWFGQRPVDRRRAWEQPAQLAAALAFNELRDVLGNRSIFDLVHQLGGSERLHRFWIDIEAASGLSSSTHYEELWPRWCAEMSPQQKTQTSARLQAFLRHCRSGDRFLLELAQDDLNDLREAYGESDIRYLRQAGACAAALAADSDLLHSARSLAEQACSGVERLGTDAQPALAAQLLTLARICLKQRDWEPGLAAARRSLALQESLQGPEHPSLIPRLNCITDLLLARAGRARKGEKGQLVAGPRLLEAITLQSRCLRILARTCGKDHLDASASMIRTGRVFARCERTELAAQAYRKAWETRARLLGSTHPLTRSARRLLDGVGQWAQS